MGHAQAIVVKLSKGHRINNWIVGKRVSLKNVYRQVKRDRSRRTGDPCNSDFTADKENASISRDRQWLYYIPVQARTIKGKSRGKGGFARSNWSSMHHRFSSFLPLVQPSLFSSRTCMLFINVKYLHTRSTLYNLCVSIVELVSRCLIEVSAGQVHSCQNAQKI